MVKDNVKQDKNYKSNNKDFGQKKKHFKANEGRDNTKNRKINKKRGTSLNNNEKNVLVAPHSKFQGIYVSKGKEDFLLTKNMTPGLSVYGEKRISVTLQGKKMEYRVWNCYRSKLAAAISRGLRDIFIKPKSTVLYLGAANGTTLSHVCEIVGPDTLIYAVEFSQRTGRDLLNLAQKRQNIVPIIEDARLPHKYRMLVDMVDVIFSDVSQPDQTRIVIENAKYFLKDGGGILISIKASSVDSTVPPENVYANEIDWLKKNDFNPKEQVKLEPYEKNHAVITGIYKAAPGK